ncbi:MAG: SDR family oxidoreductase [Actinomycetota bacterium]
MSRRFEDKVAVISGGTRGIGRAVAERFTSEGASVALCYVRNGDAARATAAELEGRGVKVLVSKVHLGEPDNIGRWFDEIAEVFGRVDFFISNAASGVIKPLGELTARHFDWSMNTNARPLLLGAQRAAGLMTEGGSVVALSSQGAGHVLPGYAAVGASKAALESLVRYLAVELAPAVRVNAVSPGVVDTEALRHFPMRAEMLAAARDKTPAGRLVDPTDIAGTVAWLCSDEATMTTGQTITIDGGAALLA